MSRIRHGTASAQKTVRPVSDTQRNHGNVMKLTREQRRPVRYMPRIRHEIARTGKTTCPVSDTGRAGTYHADNIRTVTYQTRGRARLQNICHASDTEMPCTESPALRISSAKRQHQCHIADTDTIRSHKTYVTYQAQKASAEKPRQPYQTRRRETAVPYR